MPTTSRRRNRGASALPPPLPRVAVPRVVLLDLARDADGEPRPAVMWPGSSVPTVYTNLAAAVAATRVGVGR